MATREIEINARIANLTDLQKQLKSLTVDVKLVSPALDKLLTASTKGLNIEVRATLVGQELKQLLDLAKNGINVNVRGNNVGSAISNQSRKPAENPNLVQFDPKSNIKDNLGYVNQANKLIAESQIRGKQETLALQRQYDERANKAQLELLQNNARQRTSGNLYSSPIGPQNVLNGAYSPIYPGLSARGRAGVEKNSAQAEFERVLSGKLNNRTENPTISSFTYNPKPTLEEQKIDEFVKNSQIQSKIAAGQKLVNEKAQAELSKANILEFGGKRQELIKGGASPGSLAANFKLFDINRLKQPNVAEAVLFSGLLGGPGGAAGSALGAATFGGTAGALAGTAGIVVATASFEKLLNTLEGASNAALGFERNVAAITGVLGATNVVTRGGERVSGIEAYRFNKAQATKLATAARQTLAPLGIGGEEEQSLAQAFIQSRTAQGYTPTTDFLSKNLGRIGAFYKLNASDVSDTRIYKDITDILTGSSNAANTSLGARLKPIAPELFQGKTLNDEQLDKALSKLDQFFDAFTKGDDFIEQRLRLEGQLSNLQINVGESLNQALVPGMQALNTVLSSPGITAGLEHLATGIGGFISFLIKEATRLETETGKGQKGTQTGINQVLAAKGIDGRVNVPEIEPDYFQSAFDIFTSPLQFLIGQGENASGLAGLKTPGINLNSGIRNFKPGPGLYSGPSADTQLTNLLTSLGLGNDKEGIANLKKLTEVNATNNPYLGLANAQELLNFNPKGPDKLSNEKYLTAQLGGHSQQLASLTKQQSDVAQGFDTGTLGGALGANASAQGFISKRLAAAQGLIQDRTAQFVQAPPDSKAAKEALAGISAAQDEYNKILAEGSKITRERFNLEMQRNNLAKEGFDTSTYSGQKQAAQGAVQAAKANIGGLKRRLLTETDPFDREKTLTEIRGEQTNLAGGRRGVFQANLSRAEGQLNFANAAQQFAKEFLNLTDKSKELTIALGRQKTAIDDFTKDANLRSLGRQGQILSQADKVASLGGNPNLTGTGIASNLVKGTLGFDEDARNAFELQLAQGELGSTERKFGFFGSRAKREDQDEASLLGLGVGKIKREQASQPLAFLNNYWNFLKAGSTEAMRQGVLPPEEETPDLSNVAKRAVYGNNNDKDTASEAGKAINKNKEDQEQSLKNLKSELSTDKRTLSQLSKADLADVVDIGTTRALNSHFQ